MCCWTARFQSTPPVKAATSIRHPAGAGRYISIHAAREGGDGTCHIKFRPEAISIHAAREGGDYGTSACCIETEISIHAAREGGDPRKQLHVHAITISIHAAREGGDVATTTCRQAHREFQSTPPVKAATYTSVIYSIVKLNFNPRRP